MKEAPPLGSKSNSKASQDVLLINNVLKQKGNEKIISTTSVDDARLGTLLL